MFRKTALLVCALCVVAVSHAQTKNAFDSIPDYDALFSALESFIDSITAPRSFTTVNVSMSNSQFQYQTSSTTMKERHRLAATPSVGYYNKNGLGLSAMAALINDQQKVSVYQTAATGSYDYLKNRRLLTGISFTKFFTKKDLPFYTSPLSNEVYAYFSYRKWWLKPALAAGYGWGSITNVEERKEKIKLLKGKPLNSTTIIETTEAISDLSLSASLKHDFYWLNVLTRRDYFRVTPQVVLTGGTQKFGLSQTSNSYASEKRSGTSVLYDTDNSYVSAHSNFQLLSLSTRLRTEYSKGIYFIQPQLLVDYYFPEQDNRLAAAFIINAGILF